MSANVTDMARRGRPAGLLINPEAARFVLGNRSQKWWSDATEISTAHLSAMLSGTKGATPDVAERMAAAVNVSPGVIFPELVEFTTTIRHFTAPRVVEEAA